MSSASHLPALLVALPLIAAPLCVLVGHARLAHGVAVVAAWASFAVAVALLLRVGGAGEIVYHWGGWAPPWGIAYVIDPLSALMLVLVAGMAAMVLPAAGLGPGVEVAPRARRLFHALVLLALAGMLGIVATGDVFNLYVFLEIASLASYALVAAGADRRAGPAAFNYLVQGTIGATFILVGIGLVYMMTGTLNMADLAPRLRELRDTAPVQAALAFVLVGAAIKFALFPAHLWMPNAYAHAPSLVSAFLAATATKVGAYIMIRFVYSVFGADWSFGALRLDWVFVALGLAAALAGSLVAIWQHDLKRMLAYSSVAQIGYIAAAIGFGDRNGLVAAIVHMFNHGLMKGALFLVMAGVALRLGTADLASFRGLGRRMPVTMACFTVAGLSLIGVPLTVGFVSKWYLVMAAIERGLWPAAALIVLASLLAAVYVWRVVEVAYFEDTREAGRVAEAPPLLLVPTLALTALCVVMGVVTDLTVGFADLAIASLGPAW